MPLFDYTWDQESAEPYPDQASQETMARLVISVEGKQPATYLYDRYSKEWDDHIFVPLIRVAEWLVANWWNLWHESDTCREGFESRHDLSYAGNGFVFPRVIFEPMGDSVYLKVRPWDAEHAPIQFVSQYDARLDRQALQEEFTSLIEAVIERLDQKGVAHEFLKSEWQAINSLDAEEKEFCKAAAILGLDPLDIDPEEAARIAEIWNKSDPLTREEGILCADIESLDGMGAWIDGAVQDANQGQSGRAWPDVRNAVRDRIQDTLILPWDNGYRYAHAVREELDMPNQPFPIERNGELAIWNKPESIPYAGLEGCVANNSPSCVVKAKGPRGKRFILARALGDYISREHDGFGVLSTSRTPSQSMSRAFAAELLAPVKWIENKIGNTQNIDVDTLEDFADELGVSSLIIRNQIIDHGIATVVGRT